MRCLSPVIPPLLAGALQPRVLTAASSSKSGLGAAGAAAVDYDIGIITFFHFLRPALSSPAWLAYRVYRIVGSVDAAPRTHFTHAATEAVAGLNCSVALANGSVAIRAPYVAGGFAEVVVVSMQCL